MFETKLKLTILFLRSGKEKFKKEKNNLMHFLLEKSTMMFTGLRSESDCPEV